MRTFQTLRALLLAATICAILQARLHTCQLQSNATSASKRTIRINEPLKTVIKLSSFAPVGQLPKSARAQQVLAEASGAAVNENNGDSPTSLSDAVLRAYVRTNNMRAYHLDLHSYRPEAKFDGDAEFVHSENPEHVARCARHLNAYNELLNQFAQLDPTDDSTSPQSTLNAVRLADTFGRPEAGLLQGNQFWLGAYEKCLDFKLVESEFYNENINGHYCLGLAQFSNWNPKQSKTSIKVGLCLPETCSSSMLNDNSNLFEQAEQMMKLQFGSNLPFEKLKLRSVYCLPHPTSKARQYPTSAKMFILFSATLLSLCFVATIYDYLNRKMPENLKPQRNWRTILIESFSIGRNFEKFMKVRETTQQQVVVDSTFDRETFFNSITGIKCIGLIWIICAHTFLTSVILDRNLIDMDKMTQTYLANIYLAAHLMVDSFFALSGLLASYLIFKEGVINNSKLSSWIIMTVHRYWRLTPVYLVCYWFTKSIGQFASSGPLWDYGTAPNSPRLNCANESWLEAILHLSDFKSPKDHCVPFAWFIANGIKFWLVTPFLVILVSKSMKRGYALMAAIILANILLVGKLSISSNVDMKSVIEFKPESADDMLNNMGEVYTRPYSRIGAYLVGLLAGHLIYLVDSKQLEVNLSKNTKILIWTLFAATIIILTFVIKIAQGVVLDEAAIPFVFAASSALIRPLWALCTCWLVFGLAQGQAKLIARFLSARPWQILVKLSFCAYLWQGEVIAQLFLARSTTSSFAYSDLITRPMVTTLITIFVSFIMVLVLEYPLIGLEELLLPRRQKMVAQQVGNNSVKEQGDSVGGHKNGSTAMLTTTKLDKLKES